MQERARRKDLLYQHVKAVQGHGHGRGRGDGGPAHLGEVRGVQHQQVGDGGVAGVEALQHQHTVVLVLQGGTVSFAFTLVCFLLII